MVIKHHVQYMPRWCSACKNMNPGASTAMFYTVPVGMMPSNLEIIASRPYEISVHSPFNNDETYLISRSYMLLFMKHKLSEWTFKSWAYCAISRSASRISCHRAPSICCPSESDDALYYDSLTDPESSMMNKTS